MPLVLSLGVSAAQSTMNFGGPARGTEATTFILGEVHPASMSKTSPRAANSSSVGGFSRIAREAEVRNGRHLRRSKAVECIESSEVSPTTKGIKGALALGTGGAPVPAAPLSCDSRRGQPLVEWVWPSNTSPSALSKLAEKVGVSPGEISRDGSCQENTKHHMPPRSPVVIGKICEPVRPTRLDLSTCEGERSSDTRSSDTKRNMRCSFVSLLPFRRSYHERPHGQKTADMTLLFSASIAGLGALLVWVPTCCSQAFNRFLPGASFV